MDFAERIPEADYAALFQSVATTDDFQNLVTDADGKLTLKKLQPQQLVVVYDERDITTEIEKYLWIVPAKHARNNKLLLANHNLTKPHLNAKELIQQYSANAVGDFLIGKSEAALQKKQLDKAVLFAHNAAILGKSAAAAPILSAIAREQRFLPRALEAAANGDFDQARKLAHQAESVEDQMFVKTAFEAIDHRECEVALTKAQQALEREAFEDAYKWAERARQCGHRDEADELILRIKGEERAVLSRRAAPTY